MTTALVVATRAAQSLQPRHCSPHSNDRKGKTKVVECEGREEVEHAKNNALRGRCPPPPGRGRRLCLKWPRRRDGLWWLAARSMPVLAGRAAELVHSSALSFLTAEALEAKRKEEEERSRSGRPSMWRGWPRSEASRSPAEEEEEEEEEEASQGLLSTILSVGSTVGTCSCVSLRGSSGGDSRLCVRDSRILDRLHWCLQARQVPRRAVLSRSQDACRFRAFVTCGTVRSSLFHVASLGGVSVVVSAVKVQGHYGSCWTLSTTQVVFLCWY